MNRSFSCIVLIQIILSDIVYSFVSPSTLSLDRLNNLRVYSTNNNVGLLTGITNINNDTLYTTTLNLKHTMKAYTNQSYIYQQLLSDLSPHESVDEYLTNIITNATNYRFLNKLCGHKDFLNHLSNIVETKGNFVLLTGGPSLGKTLMLTKLARKSDHIIYLDGRKSSGTMTAGICNALLDKNNFKDQIEVTCPTTTTKLQSVTKNITDFFSFKSINRLKQALNIPDLSAIDLFTTILGSLPKTTGIVYIDVLKYVHICFIVCVCVC